MGDDAKNDGDEQGPKVQPSVVSESQEDQYEQFDGIVQGNRREDNHQDPDGQGAVVPAMDAVRRLRQAVGHWSGSALGHRPKLSGLQVQL